MGNESLFNDISMHKKGVRGGKGSEGMGKEGMEQQECAVMMNDPCSCPSKQTGVYFLLSMMMSECSQTAQSLGILLKFSSPLPSASLAKAASYQCSGFT